MGVTNGVYAGLSPDRIPDGFSPSCQNWVYDNGQLAARSGLSRSGGTVEGLAAMGVWRVTDAEGF